MSFPLTAIGSQLSSAALTRLTIDDLGHKEPPVPDPIGPVSNHLDAVALNPQPLPPKEIGAGSFVNRFDAVAVNPQPLPPRELVAGVRASLLDAVALNPQPLPPKESGVRADADCGTVTGHLPHVPPSPPNGPWAEFLVRALAAR